LGDASFGEFDLRLLRFDLVGRGSYCQ